MIKSLHKKHNGQSCAILFNGPTLSDHDLTKIDCPIIGINRSWMFCDNDRKTMADMRRNWTLRPVDYHVAFDDTHWRFFANKHGDVTKLAPLITGPDGPDHAIKLELLDPVPPEVGPMCSAAVGFSWDLEKGIYLLGSISIFALQVAAYMGFTTFYLLGLDLCDRDGYGKFKGHPDSWRRRDGRFNHQHELMGYAAATLKGRVQILNVTTIEHHQAISKCSAFPKTTFEEEFSDEKRRERAGNRDRKPQQPTTRETEKSNISGAGRTGQKEKGQRKGRKGRKLG
jgi:hypothetical protein